jgi:hypothetical protein
MIKAIGWVHVMDKAEVLIFRFYQSRRPYYKKTRTAIPTEYSSYKWRRHIRLTPVSHICQFVYHINGWMPSHTSLTQADGSNRESQPNDDLRWVNHMRGTDSVSYQSPDTQHVGFSFPPGLKSGKPQAFETHARSDTRWKRLHVRFSCDPGMFLFLDVLVDGRLIWFRVVLKYDRWLGR